MKKKIQRTGLKVAEKNYAQAKANSKPGAGPRFAAMEKLMAAKGMKNPGAVAATIGRKKYGAEKFKNMAAKGKK
jgi:hypothetical protein